MSTAARPLRIALCTRTYNAASGGLQGHTAQLGRELRRRGHQVRVITRALSIAPSYGDFFFYQDPVASAEVEGIPVTVLRRPRWWRPLLWTSFKCCWRPRLRPLGVRLYAAAYEPPMRAALAGFQVAHLIGHGADMIGFAANKAAKGLGMPFLVQSCVHPGQSGDSAIDWMLYRQATGFLTNTDFERDYYRQRVPASTPVHTVYCGVENPILGDGERFRAKHGISGPTVLFLGRRDADKGYPILRDAFRMVQETLPQATLVCAGTRLEAVTPWSGRGRVVELGWISAVEKQQALAACDVLCVPSAAESFGMVFIEAGLHGKPVIARNLPVLRELLGERDCGLLLGPAAKAGNDVPVTTAQLAGALLGLLDDPVLARRMGEQGRQRGQRFLWPSLVGGYEETYRTFVGRRP